MQLVVQAHESLEIFLDFFLDVADLYPSWRELERILTRGARVLSLFGSLVLAVRDVRQSLLDLLTI